MASRTYSSPKITKRDAYLRKKYSITEAIYWQMLKVHDGACWICRKKPLPGKALNVDHEHGVKKIPGSGGKVRGLLCWFCNRYMVGRRKTEHAPLFRRTADYLEATKDWRKHGSS